MAHTRQPTVWALFRQHDRASQTSADPGLDLEGFATITDAADMLTSRLATGQGRAYYLHPDREGHGKHPHWPDHDPGQAHALVWLATHHTDRHAGWQPDATSEPDERWTVGPRGGLRRARA